MKELCDYLIMFALGFNVCVAINKVDGFISNYAQKDKTIRCGERVKEILDEK